MESLKKAFDLINKNKEKGLFGKKKSEDLCQKAEEKLHINFPPTYRLFLQEYGYGGLGPIEIYGLIDSHFDLPGEADCVWQTLDERKNWNLPPHLIIISDTGDGYWYALDSSKTNAEGEYPVVVYYDDAVDEKNRYEKVAEDFGDFLLEQVTQALEDDPEKEE